MLKLIKESSHKRGLPPGTMVYIGAERREPVKITLLDYDEEHLEEREVQPEDCFVYKDKPSTTWINVTGIHDIDVISRLGKGFNLHPLMLEDIVNTAQRPKAEEYDDMLFIVVKRLYIKSGSTELGSEQISMVLMKNVVLTFQEREGDDFNPVRKRIDEGRRLFRKLGPDYLVYALLDAIVDNYFFIVEHFSEEIDKAEEELLDRPTLTTLKKIQDLKRALFLVRKTIWSMRDVIGDFMVGKMTMFKDPVLTYMRDVHDHLIQIIENLEVFREVLSSLLEIYLTNTSNKMNETIKVLTFIATLFIPLTFIVGLYGMNFKYMPELEWHYGYFAILGVMAVLTVLMIVYLKLKKWI
jgi:magnesium transporter